MIEIKNCQKVYSNGNIGIQEVNLKFPNKGLVGVYGKKWKWKIYAFKLFRRIR